MENNITAIWGSPGSGKTLTAVKIAKCLADQKKNVILVGCDVDTPMIPLLYPSKTDTPSIGDLLSQPTPNQMSVLNHCVPFGTNKHISLLGYKKNDNIKSYPKYDISRAKNLFSLISDIADHVIIDCASHFADNPLTTAALEEAGLTLRIVNPGLKSLIYLKSQKLLLQGACFKYGEQISIINNVMSFQDENVIDNAVGGASYVFPHVTGLIEQYDTGQLLESVFGRNARQYEAEMRLLVKELF